MTTRVAVLGAQGRMGSTSVTALEAAEGLEVVAQVDVGDPLERVTEHEADVALVFTTPDVALEQVLWCVEQGVHVVVGTSGFDGDRLRAVSDAVEQRTDVSVLVVPNFSIGAVLLMRFAATAAPFFESVEIIEMHHPAKVDAPCRGRLGPGARRDDHRPQRRTRREGRRHHRARRALARLRRVAGGAARR